MKTEEFSKSTRLTITAIKQHFQPLLAKASVGPLQSGLLDEKADLEFLAQKQGLNTAWAVQVFVFDRGETRHVRVVALGDGGFSRVMQGAKALSLGKSRQVAEQLLGALG